MPWPFEVNFHLQTDSSVGFLGMFCLGTMSFVAFPKLYREVKQTMKPFCHYEYVERADFRILGFGAPHHYHNPLPRFVETLAALEAPHVRELGPPRRES